MTRSESLVRIALIAALSLPAFAAANLRPPVVLDAGLSTALHSPDDGLTVLHERLTMSCDSRAGHCRVRALYRVRSTAAHRLAFDFILPRGASVEASVAGSPAEVSVMAAKPLTDGERKHFQDRRPGAAPLARARFVGRLPVGVTEIDVSYVQALSEREIDYGYASCTSDGHGTFVAYLVYEVWPLKGWDLDPAFRLDLRVSVRRDVPSLLARVFGSYVDLECTDNHWQRVAGPAVQRGRSAVLTMSRARARLPDRLRCTVGPHKYLKD